VIIAAINGYAMGGGLECADKYGIDAGLVAAWTM
jgi:hypothetical protein